MRKVFVDTDVCIDLLSGRKPYNKAAETIFSLADFEDAIQYIYSLELSTHQLNTQ